MRFLFLLFVILPIVEITLLLKVGQAIGAWYTVGLVLLSAFIGVNMLRHQGLATLSRAQQRMDRQELPGQEMVEGIVLAVGGALLVTPGFVTDVIGFSCLIPPLRQGFARLLMSRFTVIVASRTQSDMGEFHQRAPGEQRRHGRNGDVIEGEIVDRDEDKNDSADKG
ncbi:membrane protein [Marinobacterium zhoushanense]|uniref:Membrane protein n=1 Tax=Marinobacterium zhoushanense TaxID=1679163 RepID=A0ABQ1K437_9GAMM|nr:FxsA family protein [Marinobacterium zhoushanense]GGB83349.1 membrane protein [Marinobacterium zhoushanense]